MDFSRADNGVSYTLGRSMVRREITECLLELIPGL